MNNEPVAWMCKDDDVITDKFKKSGKGGDCSDYNIPLYTHPAKTLTDEEKIKLIGTLKWAEDLLRSSCNDEAVNDVQDCLMILRKAQEK